MLNNTVTAFVVTPELIKRGVAEIIADEDLVPTCKRSSCDILGLSHFTLDRWISGDRAAPPVIDLTLGGALDCVASIGHQTTDQDGHPTYDDFMRWKEQMFERHGIEKHTDLARSIGMRRETIDNYDRQKSKPKKYIGIAMNAALQCVRPYSIRHAINEKDYIPPWKIPVPKTRPEDVRNFIERFTASGRIRKKVDLARMFAISPAMITQMEKNESPIRWALALSALANDLPPVADRFHGARRCIDGSDVSEWEGRMYSKFNGVTFQSLMSDLGINDATMSNIKRDGAPIVYGYAMAALEAGLEPYQAGDDLRLRSFA